MQQFVRQVQLFEVGEAGQARILARCLLLPSQCSTEETAYARLYGERCGLRLSEETTGQTVVTHTAEYPFAIAAHFRHAESRAVGVGAAVAQANVLLALGCDSAIVSTRI
jgi:hypothetical protein